METPTSASVAPTGWLAALLAGVGQIFMLGQPLAGALVLLGLLAALTLGNLASALAPSYALETEAG